MLCPRIIYRIRQASERENDSETRDSHEKYIFSLLGGQTIRCYIFIIVSDTSNRAGAPASSSIQGTQALRLSFHPLIHIFLEFFFVSLHSDVRGSWGALLGLVSSLVLDQSEVDLDSGVDLDGGDGLEVVVGAGQVNHSLVNSHLESVEGVGSLTARGLSDVDHQGLGGDSDGTLDSDVLDLLGSLDELSGDSLDGVNVLAGESDSGLALSLNFLFSLDLLVGVHFDLVSLFISARD